MASAGLHHARAREGEEIEGEGGGGGGGMKGLGQLIALSAYLMAGFEKKRKINGGCRKRRVCS